ncbi:MAG: hypothetical protein UZ21_OP11001000861 [Microgenomates bacterium OLB22]|nr:MAG: hypothetical protein UZ21_OP11001000861 [Microgenomates bacterium OLB22]
MNPPQEILYQFNFQREHNVRYEQDLGLMISFKTPEDAQEIRAALNLGMVDNDGNLVFPNSCLTKTGKRYYLNWIGPSFSIGYIEGQTLTISEPGTAKRLKEFIARWEGPPKAKQPELPTLRRGIVIPFRIPQGRYDEQ